MRHVGVGFALSCAASAFAIGANPALAQQQQKVGAPPEALNMRLVGSNDLQGRSAYQPVIRENHGRWIAYVENHNGTLDNGVDQVIKLAGITPAGVHLADFT